MSVSHTLTFQYDGVNVATPLTVTGQVEGDYSAAVTAGTANPIPLAWTNAKLQLFVCSSDSPVTLTTNGVGQVDTATIVAASGCTGNGSMTVTVTSAILSGSPVTYDVPVTTAANTAALVGAVVRAYLLTQTALTALYTVGGSGATVSLTALTPAANDSSLNIATATGTATGITTAASSANTTAGVAVQDTFSIAAGSPFVWYAGSGITNPFAGDVTKLVAANFSQSAAANVVIHTLVTSP